MVKLINRHHFVQCRYCDVAVAGLQFEKKRTHQCKLNVFYLSLTYICSFLFIHRYECEESFTTLNVDIRNHQNLLDSLEQYVKGDLLEGANAYHCEKCNKKVMILYVSNLRTTVLIQLYQVQS